MTEERSKRREFLPLVFIGMLLKRGMGNGEWGMGVSGNTKKIKLESAQ